MTSSTPDFGPFLERSGGGSPTCNDNQVTGQASTIFSYIAKHSNDDDDAPHNPYTKVQCQPYYHSTAQIDRLQVNTDLTGAALINVGGVITGSSVQDTAGNILAVKKDFDIPHPTKEGHRLRHVCLEGPEAGVYIRGKLKGTSITVPGYWGGLIDPETISVHLTPIGAYQELYVESIQYGRRIQVRNNLSGPIECYYTVTAERKDGEKLIAEYKGTSIEDYPGNNAEYSHNK
tara:strand:+ start:2100 stop:2795 length:696 start_codon:yes stop_codon:yes gene_type:complete